MDKIVTTSVSILRLEGTASMCVTAMLQIVTMLKAAYSILGVCTHNFINHKIKCIDILELKKTHRFFLVYLISLQLQLYIFDIKQIDYTYKIEVSVTDYKNNSTLHLIYKTVTEEQMGNLLIKQSLQKIILFKSIKVFLFCLLCRDIPGVIVTVLHVCRTCQNTCIVLKTYSTMGL